MLKRRGLLVAAVLLVVAAVVPTAVSLAGTDPEPTVVEYPASNFEPGLGWPAGWTPPAPPTGLTESERRGWEEEIRPLMPDPKPERLEFRVLTKLPDWTKQYPYQWEQDFVTCGNVAYSYHYPFPDTFLYFQTHNVTIAAIRQMATTACTLSMVKSIWHNHEMTPEDKEQSRLADKLGEDSLKSRGGMPSNGGLPTCRLDLDGTVDNIYVCFNDGNASAKFDVPAYNDPAVGRVRVPVRFVSELMGAAVNWEQATATVTIAFPQVTRNVVHPVSLPGHTPSDWYSAESYFPDNVLAYKLEDRPVTQAARVIQLRVGANTAVVDGKDVHLDAPPVILPPGRVMVPVRFVAEQMGAKVYWVGNDPIFKQGETTVGRRQVHIFTPFYPYYEYPSWHLEHLAMKF